MRKPIVIIGVGQMGGVFARGFLRIGHPVFPVLRETPVERAAGQVPDPELVLVAVAEGDLQVVLRQIPERWSDRVGLLQNELLPRHWQEHGIEDPTVIVVWFEKKSRSPVTPLIASPVHGPHATLVAEALTALDIPTTIVEDYEELVSALVMKNLYILTVNIAGLQGADTVGGLLEQDAELTRAVFADVLRLQEALTDSRFEESRIWAEFVEIVRADPDHGSKGRSAPERLRRALTQAKVNGLNFVTLSKIADTI